MAILNRCVATVVVLVIAASVLHAAPMVRVKDIGKILQDRDNQIYGFGLVVGLRNTGDSHRSIFTNKALTNVIARSGIAPETNDFFRSRNVAAVMVTAQLPLYSKKGQTIPVTVSSIGDSISLSGGTLLMAELKGADNKTYVVAQGSVVVHGDVSRKAQATILQDTTTVGLIPNGGIVEAEVPRTVQDQRFITVVLNQSNYITASRVAKAMNDTGFFGAMAVDSATIKIPFLDYNEGSLVDLMAQLEMVEVEPDGLARVVINARTGTIVIGEKVRLLPVALTHGNVSIQIKSNQAFVQNKRNPVVVLEPRSTLDSLVSALNKLGTRPKDLIAIIQSLKASGALIAHVEVI
ncbi:flagellar biosynthesis protein FlgA [bacterium]|jgi:flagellar P-ring protein FlgI|nr:flagellar biosynthesis protein FlgA [bacterium]|tara:strand:+ start:992 stop:2041 length:1050 start_codon:yes stop_codon:yes gene_type:complete